MTEKVSFSSKRFLLTLMLCSCSVILLQNYDLSSNGTFTFDLLCLLCGISISLLLFIPAVIIKRGTGHDLLSLAGENAPGIKMIPAVFYALYFIYTAEFFLLPYTDMFHKKYYSEVSPCVIALLLLIACVYAAVKGVNVITRFGIFLFAFALLTNGLMFGGSISTLDFSLYGFEFGGSVTDFWQNTLYFVTPAFIAALFVCLSENTDNFKLRQPFFALVFTGIKFAFIMFFLWFSLGDYANRQEYQTFVLSRAAGFGGIESLYLALATMSVFMIISLILCAVTKSVKRESDAKYVMIFSSIIFAAHICGSYLDSVKELFTNTFLFVALTFVATAVIPLFYIFKGRKSNARKALHNNIMS